MFELNIQVGSISRTENPGMQPPRSVISCSVVGALTGTRELTRQDFVDKNSVLDSWQGPETHGSSR